MIEQVPVVTSVALDPATVQTPGSSRRKTNGQAGTRCRGRERDRRAAQSDTAEWPESNRLGSRTHDEALAHRWRRRIARISRPGSRRSNTYPCPDRRDRSSRHGADSGRIRSKADGQTQNLAVAESAMLPLPETYPAQWPEGDRLRGRVNREALCHRRSLGVGRVSCLEASQQSNRYRPRQP